MSTVSAFGPDADSRPWSPGARFGALGAVALALLAVLETLQAFIAPWQAPVATDWIAAAAAVRANFRPGDLIVAAPSWADPVMRLHMGEMLPIAAASRMDDARFGRVWVVAQRRAHAAEEAGRVQASEARFGALTLRRFERAPAQITYDFLERWQDAYVTDWDLAARKVSPCPWQQQGQEGAFVCPLTGNSARRALVEVDQQIRRAILAPPVLGGIVAVEFQSVTMGKELVVAAGLHDTWARKSPGSAYLEIWIAGLPAGGITADNRSGWRSLRLDTSIHDGQTVPVRFQISSAQPALRNLSFAAEARR